MPRRRGRRRLDYSLPIRRKNSKVEDRCYFGRRGRWQSGFQSTYQEKESWDLTTLRLRSKKTPTVRFQSTYQEKESWDWKTPRRSHWQWGFQSTCQENESWDWRTLQLRKKRSLTVRISVYLSGELILALKDAATSEEEFADRFQSTRRNPEI